MIELLITEYNSDEMIIFKDGDKEKWWWVIKLISD